MHIGKAQYICIRHKTIFKNLLIISNNNKVIQNNPNRYELKILKKCDENDLDYWEIILISLFDSKFNYTPGWEGAKLFGDDNPKGMLGKKHSKETEQKNERETKRKK